MEKGGVTMKNTRKTFSILLLINIITISVVFADGNNASIWEHFKNEEGDTSSGDILLKATANISNSPYITYNKTIIDTLEAERIFSEKKALFLSAYQEGRAKQQRCEELIRARPKKVKDVYNLQLLKDAFFNLPVPDSHSYRFKDVIEDWEDWEDLKETIYKGKLSSEVLLCLINYNTFLKDSLIQEQVKIDGGWSSYLAENDIPYKTIVANKRNLFYRGYNYNNSDYLDSLDKRQQIKEWEFLYTDNRKPHYDSYPYRVNYYVYSNAPQYKVKFNESKEITNVYDKNGRLVYVPMLMRNYSDLKNIKRMVYLKDFQNNKYSIKSQSARTLEHLKQTLYKVDGLNLCYNYCFFDSKAKDYIKQLETDHSEEFGYVYMIERISNVSFRVVYIHELTLKPSHCAIISYKTGKEPYTIECITTLTTTPSNIPPCYKLSTIETDENRTDKVFDKVEQMPSFPGGNAALMNYLSQNIKYPVIAEENGIQGRVIAQFVVGKDGHISDVRVAKSVDPSLDKEAVRVVKNMPKWIPGKDKGQSVNVRYTLPVTFRLN